MINFIVCDNNEKIVENVVKVIDKVMIKNNIAYKNYKFVDYNQDFMATMKQHGTNKIYILDIEVNNKSGIDISRMIRRDDLNSAIIFLTSHSELAECVVSNVVMPLGFISKFNDYEARLEELLKTALVVMGKRNILQFESQKVAYTIPLKDILYITHDSVDRKSVVLTDYSEFKISKPLSELYELLSDEFKYSHRACIVNASRIVKLDAKEKNIVFDNGNHINLLSNNYKKELKKYVNRI